VVDDAPPRCYAFVGAAVSAFMRAAALADEREEAGLLVLPPTSAREVGRRVVAVSIPERSTSARLVSPGSPEARACIVTGLVRHRPAYGERRGGRHWGRVTDMPLVSRRPISMTCMVRSWSTVPGHSLRRRIATRTTR
jgi:hypothetical protein